MAMVWVMFFFQYAAIGVFFTFINVYFHDAGLSGTEIGVLNMITALVAVGASVGWGYLSDRSGKPRLIIAAGALGAMLAVQFFPLVNGFWSLLLVACLSSLMNSAPSTLSDSATLVLLGSRRSEYGRFRMGGSIGYIIAGLSSGFLFEQTGLRLMFPVYGAIMVCMALAALLLPPVVVHREHRAPGQIAAMIRRPAWLLLIACVFLAWIAANASIMFLNVSLNAMGASQSLIGVASIISAVFELPFMFYSGALLRRFGPVRLLCVGLALMTLRFFLLGWMPAPGWAVAINILNGPGFVFFWNSVVTYANQMAPAGMSGTAQGLVVSAMNLASVVSSLLSGWLLDLLGPTGIFVVMGFLVLAALLLFAVGAWRQSASAAPPEPA